MTNIDCPMNDFECAYYDEFGFCKMQEMDGIDPYEECDAFYGLDDDWGYNEDMGFDPYLGCYTDDC